MKNSMLLSIFLFTWVATVSTAVRAEELSFTKEDPGYIFTNCQSDCIGPANKDLRHQIKSHCADQGKNSYKELNWNGTHSRSHLLAFSNDRQCSSCTVTIRFECTDSSCSIQ